MRRSSSTGAISRTVVDGGEPIAFSVQSVARGDALRTEDAWRTENDPAGGHAR